MLTLHLCCHSYSHDNVGGIDFDTVFVYDLELPVDFVPTPHDGEVSAYYLWGMDKVRHVDVCVFGMGSMVD